MKKLKTFFRKIPSRYLILAMIVAVAVSCITVAGTFASFQTTVIGTGETPVANWDFKVKINDELGTATSSVSNVKLAGSDGHANRDANDQIPEYLMATGTAGYMPVEIDGTEARVSILVTVTAYFADLPEDMVFFDNLGNALTISEAVGFTPNGMDNKTDFAETKVLSTNTSQTAGGVSTYSKISYQYYLSYSEIAEWKTAKGDDDTDFIDIGFRWAWIDNGTNDQNYDFSHMYNEIRVTGQQVTNANQIEGILAINFAQDASSLVLDKANVLNILTAPLAASTIAPTKDFYLDTNKKNADVTIEVNPGDDVSKVVLGTNRRESAYTGITKYEAVINAKTSGDVDAYISGDFSVDVSGEIGSQAVKANNYYASKLVAYLNDTLKTTATNTMYDALKVVADASSESTAFGVVTVDKLASMLAYANADDDEVLWNSLTGKFVYFKNGTEMPVNNVLTGVSLSNKVNFFKAYSAMPETQDYSIYLAGTTATGSIDVTVGFDAGNNTGITAVTYDRETATTAQTAIIRTNSENVMVIINAPLDVVNHYGTAGSINIIEVANSSYHEFGIIALMQITKGRIALEASADVEKIHLNAITKEEKQVFDDIIISVDKISDLPTFSRDKADILSTGTLVATIEATNDTEKVYLFNQGIYEQIKVQKVDENTNSQVWVDTSEAVTDVKTIANEIANNYTGTKTNGIIDDVVTGSDDTKITVTFDYSDRTFKVDEENTAITDADELAEAVAAVENNATEKGTSVVDPVVGVAIHNQEELAAFAAGTLEGLANAQYKAYLAKDIVLAANTNIVIQNMTCTLDLCGKTLSGSVGSHDYTDNTANKKIATCGIIDLGSGANLTINDCMGTGVIENTKDSGNLYVYSPGYMAPSCIYMNYYSVLTINAGTIKATTGGNSCAIGVRSGTAGEKLFINGGTINGSGCAISNNGYNNDVNIVISGGEIKSAYCGIYQCAGGLRLTEGTIKAEGNVNARGIQTQSANTQLDIKSGSIYGTLYGLYISDGASFTVEGTDTTITGKYPLAFSGTVGTASINGGKFQASEGGSLMTSISKYNIELAEYDGNNTKALSERTVEAKVSEDTLKAIYEKYVGNEYSGSNIRAAGEFVEDVATALSEAGISYTTSGWYFKIYYSADEAKALILADGYQFTQGENNLWTVTAK